MTLIAIQGRQPESPGLSPGSIFPALALNAVNGDTIEVEFATGEGDRLVVFFSSDCKYCELSLPVYQLLSDRCTPAVTLAFTDASPSTMAEWWEANRGGFSEQCRSLSIGRLLSPTQLYRLRGTPTHYLIGADGLVKHHDEGMLLARISHTVPV